MIRSFLSRRRAALLVAASALILGACSNNSNNDSSGTAQWRALNLTVDTSSVALFAGDTQYFNGVQSGALSGDYQNLSSGTYTVKTQNASAETLLTTSNTLSKDQHYTAVVYGRSGSYGLAMLPEDSNSSDITTGYGRIRVYNATGESFDVFLTQGTVDLTTTTPKFDNASTSTRLSGYVEIATGSYQLRITSANNTADVRLDIPSLPINEKTYSTLIITSGSGGFLMNAAQLTQQGAVSLQQNPYARLRAVAGVNSAGTVDVNLNGATQNTLASPAIGSYRLVAAGTVPVDVLFNGATVSSTTQTFVSGADYTIVASGDNSAPSVSWLQDDNYVPASTSQYKMRLVNAAAGSENMTLLINAGAIISDIAAGSNSSYFSGGVSSALVDPISVVSSISSTEYYSENDYKLLPTSVYTIFMLGGGTAPTGKISRDR